MSVYLFLVVSTNQNVFHVTYLQTWSQGLEKVHSLPNLPFPTHVLTTHVQLTQVCIL